MLGLCACVQVGAATFIRRKFSASAFWKEAKQFNTTAFVYVGELCRYLSFQEPSEEEVNNPISKMVGNGLRPDLGIVLGIDLMLKELLKSMVRVKVMLCS